MRRRLELYRFRYFAITRLRRHVVVGSGEREGEQTRTALLNLSASRRKRTFLDASTPLQILESAKSGQHPGAFLLTRFLQFEPVVGRSAVAAVTS